MFRYNSIRVPISIALTLAVLLPVVVLTIVNALIGVQAAVNQSQSQLQTVTALKESQIEFWRDGLVQELDTLVAEPDFLLRTRQALPDSDFPTLRVSAQDDVRLALGDALRVSTQYEALFLTTTSGEVVVTTSPDVTGFDLDTPTEPLLLPPTVPEGDTQPTLTAFAPVYDADQLIALVGGVATTSELNEILLADAGLGETGSTYLVNTEGTLLTPSADDAFTIGDTLPASLTDLDLSGQRYESYGGEEVIGVASLVPGLGVIIRAEQGVSEVLRPTNTILLINSGAALAAVILFVVGGIAAVNNNIVRPLGRLSNTAQDIAEGDLSLRADIQGNDEIAQLGQAFNKMTSSLSEAIVQRDENLRTIQDQNRELRIATTKAREAARVKGEFLSTMSHELRTPLNAIIGFSDMLLMGMSGDLTEKQHHKVARLQENGKRLLELVNDSLDLTRIEAGRIELQPEPFELQALATRMDEQMRVLADQKDLDFIVDVGASLPPTLIGDRQRIEQVIVNLLSNAFKFTEEGEVRLAFDTGAEPDTWTITVADTGAGIPPHAKELIFEEFRQLDGSTRRAYKGTGLGLAITRNLVRIMEGSIQLESELQKGSTFTVTLPILPEAEEALAPADMKGTG